MRKSYFISARALTTKLVLEEPCGVTSHEGCNTNYQWCMAECAQQNAKRGSELFDVCCDGEGHVWVALKDKVSASIINVGGADE